MKRIFGIFVMIWSLVFTHLETNYFGNNWAPSSKEEWICDLTALLLFVCGHQLFKKSIKQ